MDLTAEVSSIVDKDNIFLQRKETHVKLLRDGLYFSDIFGGIRMELSKSDYGRAVMALRDAKGNNRVELFENKSGYAGVALTDSNGKWRMVLNTTPIDGRPVMALRDAKGNDRVELFENKNGDPAFHVDGKERLQLPRQAGARKRFLAKALHLFLQTRRTA